MADLLKPGGKLGVLRPVRLHEPKGGSAPHVPHYGGLFHAPTGGRTDNQNVAVPHNSYVIPADIVGALGENNTAAGGKALDHLTGQSPSGVSGGKAPSMFGSTPIPGQKTPFSKGGMTAMSPGGLINIVVAGGEYLIHPDAVARIGNGNISHGHKILDKFVEHVRKKNIKTLKSLPSPKGSKK